AAAALGALGVRTAVAGLTVKDVSVTPPKQPPAGDGLRIAQITHVHFGPTIGRACCEKLVRASKGVEANVVANTGDLVDGTVADLGDTVAPLGELRARDGVYFVTGNHEYYSGVTPWLAELGRLGVRVLRNERVPIGKGGAVDLAGVDDYSSGR